MDSTQQEAADRTISADSSEPLNILAPGTEEKPANADKLKEQSLSVKDEKMFPTDGHNVSAARPSRDTIGRPGSLGAVRDRNTIYATDVYAPQAQAYYGGFENITGGWDGYPHYVNAEGMEIGYQGIYENPSPLFHAGYGYPQMPYGSYSTVTPPLPSVRGDGQLHCQPQFAFMAHYQQPDPPSVSYLTNPTPMLQAELSMPASMDHHGAFRSDALNSNGILFGPRPSYTFPYGSFGESNFAANFVNPPFYESCQGFDGFGSGGHLSDWSKASEGQRSLTPLSSPAASRQPIGTVGSFGHSVTPFASGMRPSYGSGSVTNSNNRVYAHNGAYHQGANFGGSLSGFGTSDRSWVAVNKGGQRGRGSGSFCSCNDTLDILSEQNKGPRALKTKNPKSEQNSSVNSKNGASPKADGEIYNRPDLVTEYGDAKFFVIKSYSEDNVHKSIKYGVWASTSSGNRKLDAAYRESREKEVACPVFLLFSVNASAQFCGVAEMVGPVDFDKSVDYWQQDKWTGQFPVKWHIIKDVPNSEFRQIIIEHNDNKPVTNSRDTQEVGLEQGLQILKIFKNYETDMSILDDFDFYEDRQKAMQERKSRQQQASLVSVTAGTGNEHRSPVPLSDDYVKHMSKSFANAVRLEDCSKTGLTNRNTGSTGTTAPTGATTQDAANAEHLGGS